MNLFFVYDTLYCKDDEDDPKDAIVYFFPVQASESHRYFLCCQLVGVAKFLKSAFSTPSIIVLDQGKFAFLWSGHYLLVLGAHSDASSNVLKDQLSFLCGIFCFYHGSINNVLKACGSNRDEFLSRMELAWSRYITLSQCFGNVLQLSMNALPLKSYKKNSHVVATANRLLHVCQLSSSVTAGCVFHNSRVLSTQFLPQLTNYLSLLSNTNAAAPVGDALHVFRNLPPDVELKYIYLKAKAVSGILRHNHAVGSRVRVKVTFNPTPKQRRLSSGSEGDVDSGNCSAPEGVSARKAKRRSPERKTLCTRCQRHLLSTRNASVASYMECLSRRSERREDTGVPKAVSQLGLDENLMSGAVNVFCHSHARMLASKSQMQHANLASCCDLEFECSLCTNCHSSTRPNSASLKRWNSDVDLSRHAHCPCACALPSFRPCDWKSDVITSGHAHHRCACALPTSKPCVTDSREEVSKIQILRCRATSDSARRLHATRRPRRATIDAVGDFAPRSGDDDSESDDFQKHVLYVQRYGGSTLVLLLRKVFDEKVINYLWNCGFTILRELEYNAEKHEMEKSYELEPSFYLLLYNYAHKVLKEFPHFPSLLLTEKHSRKTIQQIQEDFQNDSRFKSISLLSCNQSVFACQSEQSLAFYLQPEADSRKVEPLYQLRKRAARRLGKYFKITL